MELDFMSDRLLICDVPMPKARRSDGWMVSARCVAFFGMGSSAKGFRRCPRHGLLSKAGKKLADV